MWIEFDKLPEHSRVWIYQSDRHIDENVADELEVFMKSFIENWEAHGNPLKGSARILYNRFLVIGLDESFNQVTGCSTDASVHAVKQAGVRFNIDFFNRTQLPFLVDEKVEVLPLDQVRKRQVPEHLSLDTLTFDNLVNEKGQLESAWKKPVSDTWLSKYLA
ncbi:MAG: hypothetical protein P8X57_09355 [Cyclobacteriaceae bacterium]